MALADKPYDECTPAEKREWDEAADKNGPVLMGSKFTGRGFNQDTRAQWKRQRDRIQRRKETFY